MFGLKRKQKKKLRQIARHIFEEVKYSGMSRYEKSMMLEYIKEILEISK